MKKLLKYTLIIAFFAGHAAAFAAAPVWKLSKGDDVIYIGGTVHALTHADQPMPQAFMEAYKQTDTVILETDISMAQAPEFQQKVLQAASYPKGTTIQQFLEPEILKRLEKHCAVRGMPLQGLSNLRAGLLTVTLTVVELQRLGLIGIGVDEFFNLLALNDRKSIVFLETIDEQIQFIAEMGEGYENEIIEDTLQKIDNIAEDLAEMKQNWRSANLQGLVEKILEPMQADFPNLYKGILYDRNVAWVPKVEALFGNGQTEFVLVGVLHLTGEDSLIRLLEKKGYQAEQLD